MHFQADLQAALEALASTEWPARVEAVTAVRRALDAGCSEDTVRELSARLLPLVADPSWKVRQALVSALSALPPAPGVADALQRLAGDTNRYVREAAIRASRRPRAVADGWRRTPDKDDPVFQAIWTEIRRVSPSSPAETVLYDAAQRIAEASYRAVAADMTHALNTVLLAVDGFAEQLESSLQQSGGDPSNVRLLYRQLRERTALARRIVQNLRYYSAVSTGPTERVGADALLQEATDLARASAQCAPPRPTVRFGDLSAIKVSVIRDRMLCALTNVICNALEACEADGEVALSVEATRAAVTFCVQDNGCGMDDGQLAAATKRFTTNKGDTGGTGMGLAIAQHVVEEEHRGRLEIESAVGEGTTVRLVLPLGEGGGSELAT